MVVIKGMVAEMSVAPSGYQLLHLSLSNMQGSLLYYMFATLLAAVEDGRASESHSMNTLPLHPEPRPGVNK